MNSREKNSSNNDILYILSAELLIEQFDKYSKDSYRVRLHNPFTIIEELERELKRYVHGELKSKENITLIVEEFQDIHKSLEDGKQSIKDIKDILYEKIEYEYFKKELGKLEQRLKEDLFPKYILAIFRRIISNLNKNEELRIALILNVLKEAHSSNDTIILLRWVGYLATQLINRGYTRDYLFHYIRHSYKKLGSFMEFISSFEILNQPSNSTRKLKINFDIEIDNLNDNSEFQNELLQLVKEIPPVNKWAYENRGNGFTLYTIVEAKSYNDWVDYLSYVQIYKVELHLLLDSIIISYETVNVYISEITVSFDQGREEIINDHSIGNRKNFNNLFEEYFKKLSLIERNKSISKETKEKIFRAIRYFRLGSGANESHQQLLNYWIGLEYLFSSAKETGTFNRIKEYYMYCETPRYLTEHMINLNADINRMLANYERNGLKDTFGMIINVKENAIGNNDDLKNRLTSLLLAIDDAKYPLLHRRIDDFIRLLSDPQEMKKYHEQHEKNTKRHLARIYRLRNEVVHEASEIKNMSLIIENLRYYLNFMIDSVVSFFINEPINSDDDVQITMDDFFIARQISYNSFIANKYDWKYRINDNSLPDKTYMEICE